MARKKRKCLRKGKGKGGRTVCREWSGTSSLSRASRKYPPVEDISFLDGLGDSLGFLKDLVPTMDEVKTIAIAGGAAGAGVIGVNYLLGTKSNAGAITFLDDLDTPWKVMAKIGIAVAGGKALHKVNPYAGAGFSAGVFGSAVQDLWDEYGPSREASGSESAATGQYDPDLPLLSDITVREPEIEDYPELSDVEVKSGDEFIYF
ncbi:MAG: hypothetical protein ABIJ56_18920 [Pseudomonadota bacterium]